jgi:predicted transcriptional regulator
MTHDTGNVTVRMPVKTQKKLDQIATEVDRSRNWLINEAIGQYLDVYDWQEKRIRERLKKAEKGGKFYTKSQVNAVIESFKR